MSGIRRRLASLFVVLALLVPVGVLSTTVAQAAPKREKRVVCNASKVRLRAQPTKASAIVGQKTQSQPVTGTKTGTWLKLSKNKYIAYYYTCPTPKRKSAAKKATPKKTSTKKAPKKSATKKSTPNKATPKKTGSKKKATKKTNPKAKPAAQKRVVCNAPKVRLRAQPTKASAIVGQKTQGQPVTGTKTGTWLKLSKNKYIAYYYTCPTPKRKSAAKKATPKRTSTLNKTPKVRPIARKRVVCQAPVVRLRAKPTTASTQVGQKSKGQAVTGTKTGNWLKLGKNKYIAYYYTCPTPKKAALKRGAPKTTTPMRQPTSTNGSTTGPFGKRLHPILRIWRLHNGVDIGNTCDKPIVAAAAGTVTSTGWTAGGGNTTVISHGTLNGVRLVQTKYLHQSKMLVKPGQKVKKGQLIGRVGTTGMSTGCHLHFGTSENSQAVDPQRYIGPVSKLRNYWTPPHPGAWLTGHANRWTPPHRESEPPSV